jgi:hypothetical protein
MNEKVPHGERHDIKPFKSALIVLIGVTLIGACLDLNWNPGRTGKYGLITFIFFIGGVVAAVVLGLWDAIRRRPSQ